MSAALARLTADRALTNCCREYGRHCHRSDRHGCGSRSRSGQAHQCPRPTPLPRLGCLRDLARSWPPLRKEDLGLTTSWDFAGLEGTTKERYLKDACWARSGLFDVTPTPSLPQMNTTRRNALQSLRLSVRFYRRNQDVEEAVRRDKGQEWHIVGNWTVLRRQNEDVLTACSSPPSNCPRAGTLPNLCSATASLGPFSPVPSRQTEMLHIGLWIASRCFQVCSSECTNQLSILVVDVFGEQGGNVSLVSSAWSHDPR